ncbi:MAG: fimb protein [Wenzhouxiangellaceae bacterium]
MSRWLAASIHLLISAVIAATALIITFYLWYPHPLFEASGASFLLYVLVGVDVALGPLITLIIFKVGKPGLKFDLTFIAVAQVIALSYGMAVIADARPVFVVFAVDRFNAVPAHRVMEASLGRVKNEDYAELSWTGPVLVAAELPTEREQRHELMFAALSGSDIETWPEYFVPYETQRDQVLARGWPLQRLWDRHPEQADELRQYLDEKGYSDGRELKYLPLVAARRDMAMVVDAETAEVLTALPVNPW